MQSASKLSSLACSLWLLTLGFNILWRNLSAKCKFSLLSWSLQLFTMYWVHNVSSFLLLLHCDFPHWMFLSLESWMPMCEMWTCELEEIVSSLSSLRLLAMLWMHTFFLTSPPDFRQCFECTCILFLLLAPLWLSLMNAFEFWISSVYVRCEHVNIGWTMSSFLSLLLAIISVGSLLQ